MPTATKSPAGTWLHLAQFACVHACVQAQDILDIDPPAVPYPEPPSLPPDTAEAIAAQVEELTHIAEHAPQAAAAAIDAVTAAFGGGSRTLSEDVWASAGSPGGTPLRTSAVYLRSNTARGSHGGAAKAASLTEGAPKSTLPTDAGGHTLPPPSLVNDFVVGVVNAVIVRPPAPTPLSTPSSICSIRLTGTHPQQPRRHNSLRPRHVFLRRTLDRAGRLNLAIPDAAVPRRGVHVKCMSAMHKYSVATP